VNDLQSQETVSEEKIIQYMEASGVAANLNDHEKRQFIEVAKAYQLNPFKREIYCVAYGEGDNRRLSIITGYEVYLKRAERTQKLDGWSVETAGSIRTRSLRAIVTIHRKDWQNRFVHEAWWIEYKQNNRMWNEKPVTMIKKVAIAQAFRFCFPDEFGGMPYTADELSDEETGYRDVTEEHSEIQETPPPVQEEATKVPEHSEAIPEDPDAKIREDFKHRLDGAFLGKLITREERNTMVANSKKHSGKTLDSYIRMVEKRLYGQQQRAGQGPSGSGSGDPQTSVPEAPEIY
jgi:phage recombination protein Bet